MTPQRGATLAAAAATIAVALAVVLATAYWLSGVEQQLAARFGIRAAVHRALGISTAYAATPRAPLLIRSHHMPLVLEAGSVVEMKLGFKNESGRDWTKGTSSQALLERAQHSGPSVFMESTWIDTMRATTQDEQIVAHGTLALFSARFRVPIDPGTYTETFVLASLDGTQYAESATDITIIALPKSTSAAPSAVQPAVLGISVWAPGIAPAPLARGTDGTDPFFIANTPIYETEPTMRIGITYEEPSAVWKPHRITADGTFRVFTESGNEIIALGAGTNTAVDYQPSSDLYHLKIGTEWYTIDQPIRFIPDASTTLLQLTSYTDPLHWEGNTADNLFRGILEIRFVPHTGRLWAINELGIEDYVRGIVEASDSANPEFHKAQAVAARTFALYHLDNGGKYPRGQFILRNDARDQVYRGEKAASRRPSFVQAVEDTRGIVVTHDGAIAVTPYFAQSNGQTKSWTQAWGGSERAWLTSVADPICAGKREIGHGVGMAQRCAMELADQGWAWQSILHHYYTGIQLQKVY